jgi:hypothetical protein
MSWIRVSVSPPCALPVTASPTLVRFATFQSRALASPPRIEGTTQPNPAPQSGIAA